MERLASYDAEMRRRAQEQIDEFTTGAQTEMNETIKKGDLSKIVIGLVEGAGKVMGKAAKAVIDTIGGGYDPAEVRGELIDAYINREYLLAPRPQSTPLPWKTPGHPTAAVLANYEAARQAQSALGEGKLDKAESLGRRAVGAPTKAHAYPRMVFFELRAELANFDKAYRKLQIACDGPERAFGFYEMMIELQLRLGRTDEAVRLVEIAARRLGDPPNLYPYQIAIFLGAEKKVAALALYTKCVAVYPDLAPQCNRAFGGLEAVAAAKREAAEGGSLADKLFGGEGVDPTKALTTGFTGQ